MPIRRKNPIKRNNKFFSGEDYNVQMDFAKEYMEQHANQTIILYQVDLEKTKVDDIYKEARKSDLRFKTPIELTCIYEIQDTQMKAYSETISKGLYAKPGTIIFSVLLEELEENGCDIKRGDYIGVDITPEYRIYFTVTNDGKMGMTANKNTLYGKMPFYVTCEGAYVDETEFNG